MVFAQLQRRLSTTLGAARQLRLASAAPDTETTRPLQNTSALFLNLPAELIYAILDLLQNEDRALLAILTTCTSLQRFALTLCLSPDKVVAKDGQLMIPGAARPVVFAAVRLSPAHHNNVRFLSVSVVQDYRITWPQALHQIHDARRLIEHLSSPLQSMVLNVGHFIFGFSQSQNVDAAVSAFDALLSAVHDKLSGRLSLTSSWRTASLPAYANFLTPALTTLTHLELLDASFISAPFRPWIISCINASKLTHLTVQESKQVSIRRGLHDAQFPSLREFRCMCAYNAPEACMAWVDDSMTVQEEAWNMQRARFPRLQHATGPHSVGITAGAMAGKLAHILLSCNGPTYSQMQVELDIWGPEMLSLNLKPHEGAAYPDIVSHAEMLPWISDFGALQTLKLNGVPFTTMNSEDKECMASTIFAACPQLRRLIIEREEISAPQLQASVEGVERHGARAQPFRHQVRWLRALPWLRLHNGMEAA